MCLSHEVRWIKKRRSLKQSKLIRISFSALIIDDCFDLWKASATTCACSCEQLHIGQIVAVVFSDDGSYFFFGNLIALTDHYCFFCKYMNNDYFSLNNPTLMWNIVDVFLSMQMGCLVVCLGRSIRMWDKMRGWWLIKCNKNDVGLKMKGVCVVCCVLLLYLQ